MSTSNLTNALNPNSQTANTISQAASTDRPEFSVLNPQQKTLTKMAFESAVEPYRQGFQKRLDTTLEGLASRGVLFGGVGNTNVSDLVKSEQEQETNIAKSLASQLGQTALDQAYSTNERLAQQQFSKEQAATSQQYNLQTLGQQQEYQKEFANLSLQNQMKLQDFTQGLQNGINPTTGKAYNQMELQQQLTNINTQAQIGGSLATAANPQAASAASLTSGVIGAMETQGKQKEADLSTKKAKFLENMSSGKYDISTQENIQSLAAQSGLKPNEIPTNMPKLSPVTMTASEGQSIFQKDPYTNELSLIQQIPKNLSREVNGVLYQLDTTDNTWKQVSPDKENAPKTLTVGNKVYEYDNSNKMWNEVLSIPKEERFTSKDYTDELGNTRSGRVDEKGNFIQSANDPIVKPAESGTLTDKQKQNNASFNMALNSLDNIDSYSKKIFDSGFRPINKIVNVVQEAVGNTDVANFEQAATLASKAIANAFEGGRLSDTDFIIYTKALPSAQDTLEQRLAKSKQMRKLLDTAIKTSEGTYKSKKVQVYNGVDVTPKESTTTVGKYKVKVK